MPLSLSRAPVKVSLKPPPCAPSTGLTVVCGAMGVRFESAPMGAIAIRQSLPKLQGRLVGVPRALDDAEVGLVAALRHDQVGHLLAHVDVRVADVAVLVGERVVRLVHQPALTAAEGDLGDPGALPDPVGAALDGLRD